MTSNSRNLAWRIRRHAIEMTHVSHGSHIGSALSMADIVAVLYQGVLHVSPENPRDPDRDRFILSKGHAGVAAYAALAERGFFPVEELLTHYGDGSKLSGHISHKGNPGIELSTGSLGHGLGVGCGMAYVAKRRKPSHHIYVLMGDGECDEGSVWEAVLFANHHRLNNLFAIIDHNRLQSLDTCENTLSIDPLGDKFQSFGWNVRQVDGHDHQALLTAFSPAENNKPVCVIAHTIKGKGVSFMENQVLWHYRDPQGEYYTNAVRELEKNRP